MSIVTVGDLAEAGAVISCIMRSFGMSSITF